MNNKGQSLVTFILLLPLITMIIALVIDTGNVYLTKQKYENEIKDAIKYSLKEETPNENNIRTLLDKNIDGTKTITIQNNTITINTKDEIQSLFSNIFQDRYKIDITYTGYKENNKLIIKKE